MNKPVIAPAQIVADGTSPAAPCLLDPPRPAPDTSFMITGPLLKATGLGAMRGDRLLFRDMSLEIEAGEAILLRGANGAGKTTLLRILSGLATPDAGTCTREPHHWVGHRAGLKPHETPSSHLELWSKAWGANADIVNILAKMALTRASDVPASGLSAGQRRRTALARTQLTPRPLWLLDEPFSALDDAGKTLVKQMINAHRASGGAVIAAVHGDVPVADAREVTL